MRILLFPLSVIYGAGVVLRNLLYKFGIYHSNEFDFPIICVGNLSFGGTGKTPHIEYLIHLLQTSFKVAVLSRGYKRKTKGYIFADENSDATQIGDEPFQIKNKFKEIAVAVSENRVFGVPNLLADAPETQVILMDDGFQHRSVKAGKNIILTDYSRLYTRDFIAPSGMLREFRSGSKRAQIIIVSKCPTNLSIVERQNIIEEISSLPSQKIFFTYQNYDETYGLYDSNLKADKTADVLLFAGIASIYSLEEYLRSKFNSVSSLRFADHKKYSEIVIETILERFKKIESKNKIIITTEKDAVKLRTPEFQKLFENIPVFVQPLKIDFFDEDQNAFDNLILNYVTTTN